MPRRDDRFEDDLYDDETDDDRPRRRRPSDDDVDPVGFIVPTDVSAWSIIACYTGLIGLCLPPFALIALVCGIVALRRRKKKSGSYGSITSDIRAVIGVALGGISLVVYGLILVLAIAGGGFR